MNIANNTLALYGLGCDCQRLNGLGFFLANILGKWITSPKSINVYKAPGGALIRTTTPNGYIGKVFSANTAGTWIQLSRANEWIINDSSYSFADHLTQFQLDDYAKRISSAPREQAEQVAKEVEQAVAEKNTNPFDAIASPIESIISKYAVPTILIVGGIYLAATYGKAFIQGKLSQPKT